ncbi:MAG TPA: amidoligase family protein [Syntrophales bacterium]|nr:amidoligase family protein [Syntrophales bacterium]
MKKKFSRRYADGPRDPEITRVEAARVHDNLLTEWIITSNNIDGALNCGCADFETQSDSRECLPFGNCRHIRSADFSVLKKAAYSFKKWSERNAGTAGPSPRIASLLRPLDTRIHERLSATQGRLILADALARQGISPGEYGKILDRCGTVSLVPRTVFGVELECFINNLNGGREGLVEEAASLGLEIAGRPEEIPARRVWVIKRDSSVHGHANPYYSPIEIASPPLYGACGLRQIETVIAAFRKIGGGVNGSCGYHVHVNAEGILADSLVRLMLAWRIVERRFLWGIVPPGRRELEYRNKEGRMRTGGYFCKEVTREMIRKCMQEGPWSFEDYERHYSLNYAALRRHGTVEVRLAAGTLNTDKIRNWALLVLKLTDTVWRMRLGPEEFARCRSIEDFLACIGTAGPECPSVLAKAGDWAMERFRKIWQWERHPEYLEAMKADGCKAVSAGGGGRAQAVRDYLDSFTRPLTIYDPCLDANSIHNLCARSGRFRPDPEDILGGIVSRQWRFGPRTGAFIQALDQSGEILTCSCSAFRRSRGRYCAHVRPIARMLLLLRRWEQAYPDRQIAAAG